MKKNCLLRKLSLTLLFPFFAYSAICQCDDSFQTLWRMTNGTSVVANDAVFTPQKDLIVCGNSEGKGLLVHFNGSTSIRWAKTFSLGNLINLVKVISMSDGSIGIVGFLSVNNVSSLIVIKVDANGNILWTKRLRDIASVPGLTYQWANLSAIVETPDGGIAICGRKVYKRPDTGTNDRIFIFKLTVNGNIDWTREDTQGNQDIVFDMILDQGSLVLVGSSNYVPHGTSYAFLEKIDPSSGAVQFFKRYQYGSLVGTQFRSIVKNGTGYILSGQAYHFGGVFVNLLVQTNTAGDLLSWKQLPRFGPNLSDQYNRPVPVDNGAHLLWQPQYYSSDDVQLTRLSASSNTEWSYTYPQPGRQTLQQFLPDANNSAIGIGTSPDPASVNGSVHLYLLKIHSDGKTAGCVSSPASQTVKDSLSFNTNAGTWQTTQLNFEPPYDITLPEQSASLTKKALCQVNTCQVNNIAVIGDTVLCKTEPVIYTARVTGTCNIPVQWTLTPAIGTIQILNDSMARIQYTQAGSAILRASILSSCSTYTRETLIQYQPVTQKLNLGADTSICPGNVLTLSVAGQFSNVVWANGSTNTSIQVNTAGEYSVTAAVNSTCFLKDTIRVLTYPAPVVQLPHSEVLCTPGDLVLSAGNGFATYQWQDGSQQASINVSALGTYWIRVKDQNGCEASDTVVISREVQRPQGFAMFKDTAMCFGEKIQLKAAGNYSSYNWNDGAGTNPGFWIQQPGTYKITVADPDGCNATEYVDVKDKKCSQLLYVPTAFTPNNDGRNDVFSAIAYGPLDLFELRVYNRWGELIFISEDITKGWNGLLRGQIQPSDVFAWYVRYRFAGNTEVSSQKGTVALIK